jgi:hypothetical protein
MDNRIYLLVLLLLIGIIFIKPKVSVTVIVPNYEPEYIVYYNQGSILKNGSNIVEVPGSIHIYIKDSTGKVINEYNYSSLKNGDVITLPSRMINIVNNIPTQITL